MHFFVPLELLAAARTGILPYSVLRRIANEAARLAPQMLDELAYFVAQQYAEGEMAFGVANEIMNAAWSVCVSEEFWADHDRTIPEVTRVVYQAFDEGEYLHPGDAPHVDPELKYTKPLIATFLALRNNDT